MNAIAYTRISTTDQSVYSLDSQHRVIKDYCTKNSLILLDTFTDNGESSYTFDRPDWNKVEAFIRKNKNVDYLLVSDHDRLSRNLAEALLKIKELQDKFKIKVLATTDSIDTDFSDPSTFILRAFKYMMAESELHRIRQRTRSGMLQAALSGRYVTKAPYGYINGKDANNKALLIIDEEKAFHIKMIFKEYNRGLTIEEVKKIVAPYGYKQKGNSSIQRILMNPLYAGLIKVGAHKGRPEQIIRAIHQGIIAESEYYRSQTRINGKAIRRQVKEEVPLRGVLKHTCGYVMTAGNSRGREGRYYWYYVCKKCKVNISAIKIHNQLDEIFSYLSFDEERLNGMLSVVSEEIKDHLNNRGEIVAKTTKAIRSIEGRMLEAEEKYMLSEGNVSKASFTKVMNKYRSEHIALHKRMSELNTDHGEYFRKLKELMPLFHDIGATYHNLDLVRKQQFINMVFDYSLSHDSISSRTRFLHPMFSHNELILKEKGLLIIEHPCDILELTPECRGIGTWVETLNRFYEILVA